MSLDDILRNKVPADVPVALAISTLGNQLENVWSQLYNLDVLGIVRTNLIKTSIMHCITISECDERLGLIIEVHIELTNHIGTCACALGTRFTTIHSSNTTIQSIHAEGHI